MNGAANFSPAGGGGGHAADSGERARDGAAGPRPVQGGLPRAGEAVADWKERPARDYIAAVDHPIAKATGSADGSRTPTADEQMGMTWWNCMIHPDRMEVLRQANALIRGASVAQAWRLWKSNRISMSPPSQKAEQ